MSTFKDKLATFQPEENRLLRVENFFLVPLSELRYSDPPVAPDIRLEHIYYFAMVGLFVILCSLINTITLLISRFYNRQREMALRIVSGSTHRRLFVLLLTEFFLILCFSGIAGLLLAELIVPSFLEIASIDLSFTAFWSDILFYYGIMVLISFFLFFIVTYYTGRGSLLGSLQKTRSTDRENKYCHPVDDQYAAYFLYNGNK
ncbi:MAG: FtsX-like permease family protein [Bacteroides sp.]|nr:FtsX-like permease family protein [Bacteroides sp.]